MARTFRYSEDTHTKSRRDSLRQPRIIVGERVEGFILKEEARGNLSRTERRWAKKMALSDMDS